MGKKVAINGFGRIGRLTFRQLFEKGIDVVAINDLTSPANLAYLLEHDSAHRNFMKGKISAKDGAIVVDGKEIKIFAEKDPAALPWGKLGVDVVIESTGFFTSKEKAQAHIQAGAKKVIISAPADGDLKTVVYGVNHETLTKDDQIISGASCTTNCLAPVVKILNDKFGIVSGLMTTVHAVTNDQTLLDLPHSKDILRGRSAWQNIVPSSTGAAKAIGKVLPELNGKLDGLALRVPVIDGSITDLTVTLAKNVTVEEINDMFKKTIDASPVLKEVIEYEPGHIVSSDIIGSTHGSIFDPTLTKVLTVDGKQLVKVFSWYDNENSYTSQLVRTAMYFMGL